MRTNGTVKVSNTFMDSSSVEVSTADGDGTDQVCPNNYHVLFVVILFFLPFLCY